MTRKEKIEELKKQISVKKEEIAQLETQIGEEMTAGFREAHGLAPGQYFMYGDMKCGDIGKAANSLCLKVYPLKDNGEISRKGMLIDDSKPVKPLQA